MNKTSLVARIDVCVRLIYGFPSMAPEFPLDTVESLRVALLKVEHAARMVSRDAALAQFKLHLLNRLADLEAERALIQCLAPDEVEIIDIVARAALMPPLSLAELQALVAVAGAAFAPSLAAIVGDLAAAHGGAIFGPLPEPADR